MSPPPDSLAFHLRQLVSGGQATRALAVGTQHLSRAPQDLAVRLLVVELLSQRGQLKRALHHALEATQRHPKAHEGPVMLATLFEQAGNLVGAVQAWDLAAARAPDGSGEALRRGGDLCWRTGDLPGALRRLREAVDTEPTAPDGWRMTGSAFASYRGAGRCG